jgi:serine/threonine-protein kinase
MATHVDKDTFLSHLEQSGLLSEEEIQSVLPRLPATNRGRVVARAFVQMGLITKFQAELLLVGRTNGFHLGQYRILDQLGHGGMGRVFKAVHQTMNRTVALKLLAPQLVKTAKARHLFQQEVRAAGQLLHPNIVTAYDANHIGDRHYLVMEFVDGPNLDQLVRQKGPLPVGLACEIIRQGALGLQYAHDMGMVHRDIKPANLLLQRPGKQGGPAVKILDFGLARLHGPDQGPGQDGAVAIGKDRTIMGTPDFLSPEQAQGLEVDIRSDLYSLGCTFYFLLSARVPFPKGTSLEKVNRHKTEEPAPVERDRSDIPPPVAEIVRRLMAKDPAARFQTPNDVAAALAPFAALEIPAWAPPPAAAFPLPDSEPTLPSTGDLVLDKPADSTGALVGTILPDLSATPTSHLGLTPFDIAHADDRRRVRNALILAILFVLGVGGTIGFLLWRLLV